MAFLWKFDRSSCRMRRLVLLKFFVVLTSGNSFWNEDLEYGRLNGATIVFLLDSADVSREDRKGDVGVSWVLDVWSRKG